MDVRKRENRLTGRFLIEAAAVVRANVDIGWRFAHNGVVFTGAASVAVTRYRYRGSTIAPPWTPKPAAVTG